MAPWRAGPRAAPAAPFPGRPPEPANGSPPAGVDGDARGDRAGRGGSTSFPGPQGGWWMRGTALGLGIAGGALGLIVSVIEWFIGGVGTALHAQGAGTVSGLAWLALLAGVVGIVGGAMALARPRLAALLMLVACVVGFIAASLFWILSGVLLFVGALLAFLGRPRQAVAG